jgi:hypothetical protein
MVAVLHDNNVTDDNASAAMLTLRRIDRNVSGLTMYNNTSAHLLCCGY